MVVTTGYVHFMLFFVKFVPVQHKYYSDGKQQEKLAT